MENSNHSFGDLFRQLGLLDSDADIEGFIGRNSPLAPKVPIYEAPFWSAAQKEFLQQQLEGDADWAGLVDQLSMRLR